MEAENPAHFSRLRYVLANFSGRARLRAFWYIVVRRYCCEVCRRCGSPWWTHKNEPMSWWHAPDDLWLSVEGSEGGIRCPRCFTLDCLEQGVPICWEAMADA